MIRRLLSIALVFFVAISVQASVIVEATPGKAQDFDRSLSFHISLQKAIESGYFDDQKIHLPLTSKRVTQLDLIDYITENNYFQLNSESFKKLSPQTKKEVVKRLASWDDNLTAYTVQVATRKNDLENQPVIKWLQVNLKKLKDFVPAEKLLSRYAQDWAYHISSSDGPNCLHTALASIFDHWYKPQYLDQPTFLFYRGAFFEEIDEPGQWGDMVYFDLGKDSHAFTFLGFDRETGKSIVFTKNGYEQSRFLYMDLETVAEIYKPIQEIRYYRAQVMAPPPETFVNDGFDASGDSVEDYLKQNPYPKQQGFPVLKSSLKRFGTQNLKPLEVHP